MPNIALRKAFFYYIISMLYNLLNLRALSFLSKTGENSLKMMGFPTVFDINAVQSDDAFSQFYGLEFSSMFGVH